MFCVLTASSYISTLSLHDALPILQTWRFADVRHSTVTIVSQLCDELYFERDAGDADHPLFEDSNVDCRSGVGFGVELDRKSTRLNSSHVKISYDVSSLKKKKPGA